MMVPRSRDFSETLNEELQNLESATEFLLGLMDEGDSLQVALGRTVRGYGVREYSRLSSVEEHAIQRAINPEHNPTRETLEKLLKPPGLELGAKRLPA